MYTTEHLPGVGLQQQRVALFHYKQLAVTLLYAIFNLYIVSLLRRSRSMALDLLVYGTTISRPKHYLQASTSDSSSRSLEKQTESFTAVSAKSGFRRSSLQVENPSKQFTSEGFSQRLIRQSTEKSSSFREGEAFSFPSCQVSSLSSCQEEVCDLAACQQSATTISEKESTDLFIAPAATSSLCAPGDSSANAPANLSASSNLFASANLSAPADPCGKVADSTSITPDQLAELSSSGALVLVLDCRTFIAYNANHVVGALNVACSDRITKKRIADGKIGLVDVISGSEGKELYRRGEETAEIVVYDEGTTECGGLPSTHPLVVVRECLKKKGKSPRFLIGGLQAMMASHPGLCTALDSGVPLLFSPTAPEQNEAIDSAVASEILPHLFIGNIRDASNRARLAQLGITHVVNVTGSLPLYFESDGIAYKRLPASDSGSQNLSQYFSEAIEFIEGARLAEGRVLVHCQAGVSRSPSIVLAYLIARSSLSLSDAFTHVKDRRPIVAPNLNFMGQLLTFQQQQQQQQQQL